MLASQNMKASCELIYVEKMENMEATWLAKAAELDENFDDLRKPRCCAQTQTMIFPVKPSLPLMPEGTDRSNFELAELSSNKHFDKLQTSIMHTFGKWTTNIIPTIQETVRPIHCEANIINTRNSNLNNYYDAHLKTFNNN